MCLNMYICHSVCMPECVNGVWMQLEGHKAANGHEQPYLTTLSDCQKVCFNNPSCRHIDWDPAAQTKCRTFTGQVDEISLHATSTHYTVVKCTGS